jgi:hypothetical protein
MGFLKTLARWLGVVDEQTVKEVGASYFLRTATHDLVDGRVAIFDSKRPRVVTLDVWPESIFLAADGQRTMNEFIADVRAQRGSDAPADLAVQATGQLLSLVKEGLVKLTSSPQALPHYLAAPTSAQDPDEMTKQMIADGFIRGEP